MNCDTVTGLLPLLLYGELSFEDEEVAQQHLDVCAACRAERDRTALLHRALDGAEPEVDPVLLSNCRRNLRVTAASLAESGVPRRSFWPVFTWSRFSGPVGALALVAMGFFGARLMPTGTATQPMGLGDGGPVASRVRFIEPRESGQVQIIVEETRQRVFSGDMEDTGIRTLLLRAARESSDPGVRVDTMDLLKAQSQSEEVRGALLHALRQDSNAGVRLKALEALRASAGEPGTRTVLAEVVLKDDNPGVRTQAIDLLTSKHEPALVGVLQEIMTRENNTYIRMKCQRALADMNASVEMF